MNPPPPHGAEVIAWLDDLANPIVAIEEIQALGHDAVPALDAYLARAPQTVPQARSLAVQLLARQGGDEALEYLRKALYRQPLDSLIPEVRQAEFVVKNDILHELVQHSYPQSYDDIDYALRSLRLPEAVTAVATLRLNASAPVLVGMLDDEVLAGKVASTLQALGPEVDGVLLEYLQRWLPGAVEDTRMRLAAIRTLLVLQARGSRLSGPLARRLGGMSHPWMQAVAALFDTSRPDRASVLVRGALADDGPLAEACKHAYIQLADPLRFAALLAALLRNAEADAYGCTHSLTPSQHAWLVLEVTQTIPSADMLAQSLGQLDRDTAAQLALHWSAGERGALGTLWQHADPRGRVALLEAATHCGFRSGYVCLLRGLFDRDGAVRKTARRHGWRRLVRYPATRHHTWREVTKHPDSAGRRMP